MDGNYGAASNAERVSAAGQIGGAYLTSSLAEHSLSTENRRRQGRWLRLPSCFSWQGSLVVLDVKGEAFRATAGHRKAMGQDVYLFDPASESGRSYPDPFAAVQRTTAARFRQIAGMQTFYSRKSIRLAAALTTTPFGTPQAGRPSVR